MTPSEAGRELDQVGRTTSVSSAADLCACRELGRRRAGRRRRRRASRELRPSVSSADLLGAGREQKQEKSEERKKKKNQCLAGSWTKYK